MLACNFSEVYDGLSTRVYTLHGVALRLFHLVCVHLLVLVDDELEVVLTPREDVAPVRQVVSHRRKSVSEKKYTNNMTSLFKIRA